MLRHIIFSLTLMFWSVTAFAHGSGQHVLGTVTAIDANHVEVKTQKGATVSIKLTKETRFREKGNPKSTEPPMVGDRVVIEALKDNKILTATEVHYSAGKRASASTTPAASALAPTP